MKRTLLLLFAAIASQAISSAQSATQSLLFYSGSNLQYVCVALSTQPNAATVVAVSAASNANPVAFTSTAHNLFYTATSTALPVVKITGGTGSWSAVNGSFVATPTGANTFTIPVDSTSFGTFSGQTLVVTTFSPRLNDPVWSVENFQYDGSNNLTFHGYAAVAAGAGNVPLIGPASGPGKYANKCSDRATLAYE